MRNSWAVAALATALMGVAGCDVEPGASQRDDAGSIDVDGTTQSAETVECAQVEWTLMINVTNGPTRAEASLQLDGPEPAVQTVGIVDFDGFNGVVGGDRGEADVTIEDGTYTISGTAEGSLGTVEKSPVPFEIVAPC